MLTLPNRASILGGLRKEEPRLVFTNARCEHARSQIKSDEIAARLAKELLAKSHGVLAKPPYQVGGLREAREFLDDTYTLLAANMLDSEGPWRLSVLERLLRVAEQPAWPTEEPLAFAELLHAFSVAVDALPEAFELKSALYLKGVASAAELLANRPWWHQDDCNWNVVCHTAFILAAIACAEVSPQECGKLLYDSLHALPIALDSLGPDGGWPEGPGYWGYTMRYFGILLEALDSAFGQTFGLSTLPGVACAPDFRIQMEGPSGQLFGFGDSYLDAPLDPTLLIWAHRFDRASDATSFHCSLDAGKGHVFYGTLARALLWYAPPPEPAVFPSSTQHFVSAEVASARTSWSDRDALYIAFKAGDIQTPHAHADLGTFVVDWQGTRFAEELGADNYDLPGFWNGRPNTDFARWSYFRNGTQGHNAPMVDGQGQDPLGFANMCEVEMDGEFFAAKIDLTPAYRSHGVVRLDRIVSLDTVGRRIEMRDNFEANRSVVFRWQVLTLAEVTISGSTALLRRAGKEMRLSGCHTFASESLQLTPPERPWSGTRLSMDIPASRTGEAVVLWEAC
jgi:hypothetical protein